MKRALLPLVLLAACDQGWKPASVIDSLRVIGVRAEPPEVRPGEPARLEALLLDPTRAGKSTILWLGCEPDPYGLGRGACGDLDALQDPTSLIDSMKLPAGIRLIGIDDQAAYASSPSLFDAIDAGTAAREDGTAGVVISLAIAADVPFTASREELEPIFQKVQSKEIASQLTLFRVRVSEAPESNRNHNPAIDDLLLAGEIVPRGATLQLLPSVPYPLDLTAHDYEEYDQLDALMMLEHKTERLIVSWYTSAGRFDRDRIALGSEVKAELTAAGSERDGNDPIPENRRGSLWGVLRDSRGGQAWREWKWFLCDPALPAPHVTRIERTATELTLRGENLDQLLDVIAWGAAVRGAYSPTSDTWVGDAADGPLELRAKNCTRRSAAP